MNPHTPPNRRSQPDHKPRSEQTPHDVAREIKGGASEISAHQLRVEIGKIADADHRNVQLAAASNKKRLFAVVLLLVEKVETLERDLQSARRCQCVVSQSSE